MTWYNYKKCPECGELLSLNTSQLHLGDFKCDKCDWKGGRLPKMPIDDNNFETGSTMNLRDQFAVEAMKVLLKNDLNRPLYEIARTAYILADFMMKRHIESAESAVEPNTEVIDPCDYDQGSSMYMNCGECPKEDCSEAVYRVAPTDETLHKRFGEGKECKDILFSECNDAGIKCEDCVASNKSLWGQLQMRLHEGYGKLFEYPVDETPPKFGEGKKCEDIPIKECDAAGIECDACAAWELMMEKLREFEAAHGKDVPSGGELYDILKKSMATVPKWKATI